MYATAQMDEPLIANREKSLWQRSWPYLLCGGTAVAVIAAVRVVSATSASSATGGETGLSTSEREWKGERLRFVNGCERDPLWIAGFANGLPLFDKDVKLEPGASHVVPIPDGGLASSRFWPKWSCDASGQACAIGQSGGPGEACGTDGCAPPVDSKFEATFGCLPDADECARNPSAPKEALGSVDWWDVSQVDGWTLPYKVEVLGKCDGSPHLIDCSGLALSSCPTEEVLGGQLGRQSLRVHSPKNASRVVGCYSPCAKLTFSQWGQGYAYTPESYEARDFCCPTPPISPEKCSSGPVATAQYTKAVHTLCPSVYAYAYDDGSGLAQCPAGAGYKVTFYCPQ